MNEEAYNNKFHDILNGRSALRFGGKRYFCLHPSSRIRSGALLYFNDWKALAESRGVPSEYQARLNSIKNGNWSENDDEAIKKSKDEIRFMQKVLENIQLPSQKVKQKRLIKNEEKNLSEMLSRRADVFGKTSESYASARASQELLRLSIVDEEGGLIWTEKDSYDELGFEEIDELNTLYTEIVNGFSETIIQHIALQDFFSIYMPHCEKPSDFFGVAVVDLTTYQLLLSTYGKIFFNIIQQHEDIDDVIRKDPERLLLLGRKKDKNKSVSGEDPNKKNATTYFGANKDDLDILAETGDKKVTLKDRINEMSDGKGSISGKDVAKIFG